MQRKIENDVAAAVSLYRNKGAFALLLGSGVSRAANIKTGWDIVLDLLDQVIAVKYSATAKPSDSVLWYEKEYGKPPLYSDLLDELTSTPAERVGLLNSYFVPSSDELEERTKVPTAAHCAIARLVKAGFIRVIVTTNFDHLIEEALREQGVSVSVVHNDADVQNMIPIQHTECTLLKVHGDYTDARFKNSPQELAEYGAEWNTLLKRLFSDYGVLICGWSAKWDVALRKLLEENPCKHYSTFWCSPSEPDTDAQSVVNVRGARKIMTTADEFFEKLAADIEALERRLDQPLSVALLVERLKKYLADPDSNRIRINDLINAEVGKFISGVLLHRDKKDAAFVDAVQEPILRVGSVFATGVLWSGNQFKQLWMRSLRRIVSETVQSRDPIIMLYPLVSLFYCVGIAGTVSNAFDALGDFLNLNISGNSGREMVREAIRNISATYGAFDLNEDLFDKTWKMFQPLVASKVEFQELFDRWEYILSISLLDTSNMRNVAPLMGLYLKHGKHSGLSEVIEKELQSGGGQYPAVSLCRDFQDFRANKTNLDQYIRKEGSFR